MLRLFISRLLALIPLLFAISTVTFFLIHLIPGDPVDLMLGDYATDQDRAELREALGFTGSLFSQYLSFLVNLVKLDFGKSIFSGVAVSSLLFERLPATIELSLASIILAVGWGIPAGVLTASTKSKTVDFFGTSVGVLGMSLPGYFLGPILIWIFAVLFGILPVGERGGVSHLILPSLSLALPLGAILMRMTRAAMKEELTEDYIKVAYSKGITKRKVYFKHALKNALMPVVTLIGLQIGMLLTGTVITETIFNWPGLGTLLFDGIQQRDYPIVQGCILVIATIYVLVNFVTDLSYSFIDPRVKTK